MIVAEPVDKPWTLREFLAAGLILWSTGWELNP